MRLYALYTHSHAILKDRYFLSTLCDSYDIRLKFIDLKGTGAYKTTGYLRAIRSKMDLVIEAVQENWGSEFIYADVDIQFFGATEQRILEALRDNDLVCQRDDPQGNFCAGFFACRGNQRTLNFWESIRAEIEKGPNEGDDQRAMNDLLRWRKKSPWWSRLQRKIRLNSCEIKVGYLPIQFYGGGTLTGRPWHPGILLEVPKNIVMHHANWTVGIQNKIAQLNYVRKRVCDEISCQ